MRWETDENGLPVDYIGDAESTPVTEAMRELWRKYIEDAAPKNADLAWNYLGVYIYLDSGRVILFPVVSASRHRVEKAMCQITCPDLLGSFNDMADSKTDDEFDAWHTQAMERVASLASQAAREAKLPQRLGRPEVRILYFSYGGDEGALKEEVLKS